MAKGNKQRLLELGWILYTYSDEHHPLSLQELTHRLEEKGYQAERKALYRDIEILKEMGMDIETKKSHFFGYYVAQREFQLVELKLLADAVQSSRLITWKKSQELIEKLGRLTSVYNGQVLKSGLVETLAKAANEAIYYTVDGIQTAIAEKRKISFRYYRYTLLKEKEYRREGAAYIVSPYALIWEGDQYYLVGYYETRKAIAHFRVDRMAQVEMLDEPLLDVMKATLGKGLDLSQYSSRVIDMFGGEEKRVRVRVANHLLDAVIDRFSTDIQVVEDGREHFIAVFDVAVGPTFYAWLFQFGSESRILGPDDVVGEMIRYLRDVTAQYRNEERI